MLFYAGGVAAVCAQRYQRVTALFALHGESPTRAGPVPVPQMLTFDPSAIRLTPSANFEAVGATLAEALGLGSDVIDEAWQLFEILRLASQLMDADQFDVAIGNYAAADRRREAVASLDQTTQLQAEATKNSVLDDISGYCRPRGLHLQAVEKVYSRGGGFRWAAQLPNESPKKSTVKATCTPLSTVGASTPCESNSPFEQLVVPLVTPATATPPTVHPAA